MMHKEESILSLATLLNTYLWILKNLEKYDLILTKNPNILLNLSKIIGTVSIK